MVARRCWARTPPALTYTASFDLKTCALTPPYHILTHGPQVLDMRNEQIQVMQERKEVRCTRSCGRPFERAGRARARACPCAPARACMCVCVRVAASQRPLAGAGHATCPPLLAAPHAAPYKIRACRPAWQGPLDCSVSCGGAVEAASLQPTSSPPVAGLVMPSPEAVKEMDSEKIQHMYMA